MCIEAERVIVTQSISTLTSKQILYEGRAKSKHWKANYLIKIKPKTG